MKTKLTFQIVPEIKQVQEKKKKKENNSKIMRVWVNDVISYVVSGTVYQHSVAWQYVSKYKV